MKSTSAIGRQAFFRGDFRRAWKRTAGVGLAVLTLLCVAPRATCALNPSLPPSGNFDLTHWYLTRPDSSASIVSPAQLSAGFTNAAWFYTGTDGAMVFWCPVTGGTTANSTYPRSELREMLDPKDTGVNWRAFGMHTLTAQCKVTQLPSNGRVVIGQIHGFSGNAFPLLLLRYNSGTLDMEVRSSPNPPQAISHFLFPNVALSNLIDYKIEMVNGLLSVMVNGSNQTVNIFQSDPAWTNETFYFKAGSYCQDNSGPATEGSGVSFYSLNARHFFSTQLAPLITGQPTNQFVFIGSNAEIKVVAADAPSLNFFWRKDGVDLPDATNALLSINNVQTNDAGNYSAVVSNSFGAVTSAVMRLAVLPPVIVVALPDALDTSNLVWIANGTPPWVGQNGVTHDGEDAAQSGAIADSGSTTLQTAVTGPGMISFWWKVSSEPSNDRLRFYVNGSEQARISGEVDWEPRSFELSSGNQVLEWRYSKNSSTTAGQDRGWVDQVRFGPAPPIITSQPASQIVDAGTTVTLSAAASGTPPLRYQWRRNGIDLADDNSIRGATTTTLTLSNVTVAQSGIYALTVSNAVDQVTSSNAQLTVLPIVPLSEALDANLAWTLGGSPPWTGQANVTHDGVDAAQSGAIGNSKTTTMQTTVTGPGTVAFWWKVSSEPSNDRLLFYIGSSEKARITGEVDWQWRTFDVSSGNQILKWTYSKNSSKTGGLDRAWVDQVLFIPNNVPTLPIVAIQPAGTNVEAQATVTFNVGAVGSAPLSYRWQCNGTNLVNGGNVSGATTAALKLSSVSLAQTGFYSVVVSNVAGAVISSNALLTITPIVTLAEALDTTGFVWTTSSSGAWIGQTNLSYDGTDAARSGAVADGKSTSVQTTVTGPTTVSFWWKVSSEPDNDRLRFYVNGSEQARISGEVDWERRSFDLPSGSQVLQWKYSKSSSVTAGQDRGWLDRVEFSPGAAPSLAAPVLPPRSITPAISISDGRVRLTWEAESGKDYIIFYKDELFETDWTPLVVEVSVVDSVASIEDIVEDQPQRFYQVMEQ